jgi:hypothetical protein
MKKILKPGVREEYELLCDVTEKPAVARLFMSFGYGSRRDPDVLDVDLSDEIAEEILQLLQGKYPQFQTREAEIHARCPFCERA